MKRINLQNQNGIEQSLSNIILYGSNLDVKQLEIIILDNCENGHQLANKLNQLSKELSTNNWKFIKEYENYILISGTDCYGNVDYLEVYE